MQLLQLAQRIRLALAVRLCRCELRLEGGECSAPLLAHGLRVRQLGGGLRELQREACLCVRLLCKCECGCLRLHGRLLAGFLGGVRGGLRLGQLGVHVAQLRGQLGLALLQRVERSAHRGARALHRLPPLPLSLQLQLARGQPQLERLPPRQLGGQRAALGGERVGGGGERALPLAHEQQQPRLLRLVRLPLRLGECGRVRDARLRLEQQHAVRLALCIEGGHARLRTFELLLQLEEAAAVPLRTHAQRLGQVVSDALRVEAHGALVHVRVHGHLHRTRAELERAARLRVVGQRGRDADYQRGAAVPAERVGEQRGQLGVFVRHELLPLAQRLHHRAEAEQRGVDVHRLLETHTRQVGVCARALHALRARQVGDRQLARHDLGIHALRALRVRRPVAAEQAHALLDGELEHGVAPRGGLVHSRLRVDEVAPPVVEELHQRSR
mmetsp:Transcript_7803/g.19022  ORF Transcript_7803/g.19022 Transcript_7803/m.19022 type:complete len:442 (+) Transcript_7803:699-2024(+)